jgi:hypothetical protein
MKTLSLPWASLWAGSKTRVLLQPVMTIVTSVYRGWRETVKTDTPRTMDAVPLGRQQASHTGIMLTETDIRDGVRGIMP